MWNVAAPLSGNPAGDDIYTIISSGYGGELDSPSVAPSMGVQLHWTLGSTRRTHTRCPPRWRNMIPPQDSRGLTPSERSWPGGPRPTGCILGGSHQSLVRTLQGRWGILWAWQML